MTVKGIFKTLIGTIVIIVVSALIIEYFNITTTATQLRHLSNLACKQGCILFTQETYKKRKPDGTDSGAVNMASVVDEDGNEFVEGDFYGNSSARDIYNKLYTSQDFKDWCLSSEVRKGDWDSIKIINHELNNQGTSLKGIKSDNVEMLSKSYIDGMVTPLNMGIPYMDKDTLEKMFKWNLASILSNCDSSLITSANNSSNNESYIRFKGFRVYGNRARIKNIQYKVYDLSSSSDRMAFRNLTHIDPDNIGFGDSVNNNKITNDERGRVCVVGITYSVPIGYEGITPLKKIISNVWDTDVEGCTNETTKNNKTRYDFNENAQDELESGGIIGDTTGMLPVPGQLIYYIVR